MTQYTLDDLAAQLEQLRKMTGRPDMLSEVADYFRDDRRETFARVDRILAAVRPEERADPGRVGPAERARVAAESGVSAADVDRFFDGFERLQARMRELSELGFLGRLGHALRGRVSEVLNLLLLVLLVLALVGLWGR